MLDVACGGGRHTRHFHALGHPVTAVDIDLGRMRDLAQQPGIELVEADLEGGPWPFSGRAFAAVVVTNYLWRPLFPAPWRWPCPNPWCFLLPLPRGLPKTMA